MEYNILINKNFRVYYMTCGIYKLSFEGTDKVYIGKSKNIELRFLGHKRDLRAGSASKKMQEAYLVHGLPTLDIILECEESELVDAEIEAINIYDSVAKGFNSVAESRGGSVALPGELAGNALYDNAQYIKIAELLAETYMSVDEIATSLSVNRAVVSNIKHLANHAWIEKTRPDLYEKLKNKLASYRKLKNSAEYKGIQYPNLQAPDGTIHTVTCINEFARKHKLDSGNLCKLLNGVAKSYKGWYLEGNRQKAVQLLSPSKELISISGSVSAFAKANNLDTSALCKVISGKVPHHKGWTLFKDEPLTK